MQKEKIKSFSLLFSTLFFSFVSCYLFLENKKSKDIIEIYKKTKTIDQDQIRDLIYENQNLMSEKQTIATTNFVAGIIEAINKKDYYNEVWHNGYDRGVQNQILVDENIKEKQILITKEQAK